MLKRRTSAHRGPNNGPGRSQFFSQAFQASCKLSSLQPGSSSQDTGVQRLLTGRSGAGVPGKPAKPARGTPEGAAGAGRGGSLADRSGAGAAHGGAGRPNTGALGRGEGALHATKLPTIAAMNHPELAR